MGQTEDLDAWWATFEDYTESNTAKGVFQEIVRNFDEKLDQLAAMNAAGDFDQLPASTKALFVAAWQQLDAARTTLEGSADFMEALNWTP